MPKKITKREPAFPVQTYADGKGLQTGQNSGWEIGLTKLEYFAAKALPVVSGQSPGKRAEAAIEVAREMLFRLRLASGDVPLNEGHFAAAEKWDDGFAAVKWAFENGATVEEMTAWRRLQRGEDVTAA